MRNKLFSVALYRPLRVRKAPPLLLCRQSGERTGHFVNDRSLSYDGIANPISASPSLQESHFPQQRERKKGKKAVHILKPSTHRTGPACDLIPAYLPTFWRESMLSSPRTASAARTLVVCRIAPSRPVTAQPRRRVIVSTRRSSSNIGPPKSASEFVDFLNESPTRESLSLSLSPSIYVSHNT